MRSFILAAIAAFGLMAGGCDRNNDGEQAPNVRRSTVVEPETRNIDTVPQEEPAVARSQWRAGSDSARTVTGNLRVSLLERRGGPVCETGFRAVALAAPLERYRDVTRLAPGVTTL